MTTKLIEWNVHVTKDLGNYDMIIGRDILSFLEIDLRFSTKQVEWDSAAMPFKHINATPLDAYFIKDPVGVTDASDRIKKILDAKYEPADLTKGMCSPITSNSGATTEVVGSVEQIWRFVRWNARYLDGFRDRSRIEQGCSTISCQSVPYSKDPSRYLEDGGRPPL